MMALNYTGERFIPGMQGEGVAEHLHRYSLSRSIAKNMDVLDLACGEGYATEILAQVTNKAIGIDLDFDTVNRMEVRL
jgi:2-polyprenyl-3-methyl-5-hydroxy-6-metoxy-1,4-benzoquinol methylase